MSETLVTKKCVPCEGGVPTLTPQQVEDHLPSLPNWTVSDDGVWLERNFNLKHFADALSLLNQIGDLAEAEQHHPDLHLTGYRHLRVRMTTHAIGGLSENDLIMAAKINQIAS